MDKIIALIRFWALTFFICFLNASFSYAFDPFGAGDEFKSGPAIVCPKANLDSYEVRANSDTRLIFKGICYTADWTIPKIDVTTEAIWFSSNGIAMENFSASNGLIGSTQSKCPNNPWLNGSICSKEITGGKIFTPYATISNGYGWILLLPDTPLPLTKDLLNSTQKNKIIADIGAKRRPPIAAAYPATNIHEDFATLNGGVTTFGIPTNVEVMLGKQTSSSSNPDTASWKVVKSFVTKQDETKNIAVNVDVAPEPGTKYFFKIKVSNFVGNATSSILSFVTPGPPLAETKPAMNVTATSAVFRGRVNPNSTSQPARYVFAYGLTKSYGHTTPPQNIGTGKQWMDFHYTQKNLMRNTTYHYCIEALNDSGQILGHDMTFTTPGTAPPIVITGSATNISKTMATLNGTINPSTATEGATWYFEYGTTAGYGQQVPVPQPGKVAAGTTNTAVKQPAYGLAPGTTYHYRLVGVTSLGTTIGKDMVFTTK